MDTRITRWWLAATGPAQLAIAASLPGPRWATVALTAMGVVTTAGGIVHARGER